MAFDPINSPVDYVKLAGVRTPGIAEITGAELKRRFHIRQQQYASGANVVYAGRDLCHFTIELRLHNEQDLADWHAFRPMLEKDPPFRSNKGALDIQHPVLEGLGINSVVIERVSAPEQIDDGVWSVKIGCLQWRKPVAALAKPEGSKAAPVEQEDEGDRRVRAVLDQYQDLASQ